MAHISKKLAPLFIDDILNESNSPHDKTYGKREKKEVITCNEKKGNLREIKTKRYYYGC